MTERKSCLVIPPPRCLDMVHGVVKNHSGAISIHSERGVGTTFNIYLPVYEGKENLREETDLPAIQGNGEHILFVDDEESLTALGQAMLEYLGYRVTTTNGGVEALRIFTSDPESFDLVVTDQTMPNMTGADLARALLEIRPSLPVILATGYSAVISAESAKAPGISELLFKPNTLQGLGATIQRALRETRGINL